MYTAPSLAQAQVSKIPKIPLSSLPTPELPQSSQSPPLHSSPKKITEKKRKKKRKENKRPVLDLTLMEFKQKVRASNCFSCCFGASGSTDDLEERPISLIRSSSTWLKERAQELPEFSERCRGIVDRIRWRRRFTGEFSYDPLSYARNFDEGVDEIAGDDAAQGDAFRYKDFSSRLPPSPPPRPLVAIS
ncbi:DNA ligase [Rhynchospora pubera]|uniref:DNA ligase n=1 Tax=Rhynchospora pubera TaxID=906938 RepID=A0AAV8GZB6_9POAL|nr:DNA ligase [Rhynchospora pubera]